MFTAADRQAARIVIRATSDRSNEEWPGDTDDELSVIHELLHVKLNSFMVPQGKSEQCEAAIETLANTLLTLNRRKS